MFQDILTDRRVYSSLSALVVMAGVVSAPQPASADAAQESALDLSLVAARAVCTEVTVTGSADAATSHMRQTFAHSGAAKSPDIPDIQVSQSRCVTERILRVAAPVLDAAAGAGRTIGFIKVSEGRSINRISGLELSDSRPSQQRRAGLQRASYEAPHVLPAQPSLRSAAYSDHLLPPDPEELDDSPTLLPPSAFDYLATPHDVSYTPAPGSEARFDPQRANGDLRKGIRWVTRLITGEEQ